MLRHFTSICLAACATLMAQADSFTKLEPDMTEWFTAALDGKSQPAFTPDRSLTLNDMTQARTAVWDAWCKANANITDNPLPTLRPLAAADSAKWEIPAELEPDATMAFFYGSKGDKPAEGYPLFLYTHGSGPRDREWATGLKICSMFKDEPSAYFIPRIPNEGEYYRWWQRGKQWAWEKLLRQGLSSGEIDPWRIYMFGISEGGYGSQRLASFYADYLAGAGPMAGGEPLKNAPAENCRNIAFSLRTGDQDYGFYRDKLTGYVREAFDSLQAANPQDFKHWVDLIPGRGHHIDYRPTTPWLRCFTRNPWPKRVSWEDFEMDGIHRTGFYNIEVVDAPHNHDDSTDRTRYEMTITGNRVDLNVDLVNYTTTETDPRWGIPLRFARSYTPATNGTIRLYFNDKLVNLERPVEIILNGKVVFNGMLALSLDNLMASCAQWADPLRLFPASVTLTLN